MKSSYFHLCCFSQKTLWVCVSNAGWWVLGGFTDSAQFPVLQGLCMFQLEQWGRWFSIPLKGFGMLFQSRYKCYAVICTPDHIWKCLKWSDNDVFPERPRSHLYLALYTYDWCECHAITVNSAHTITSQMFEVRYLTTSWLKPCFTVLQLSFPVPWNHQYKRSDWYKSHR